MKKLLLLFALLIPLMAYADTYTNDFSNGTQPPADWTKVESIGTTYFECDAVSIPGLTLGHLYCGNTQYPIINIVYDNGTGWTITEIEFDVVARSYWSSFEVYFRCAADISTYYSVEFDISNDTINLYKDGDTIDTTYTGLSDSDNVRITMTGTDPLTITVYINDVEQVSGVDSSSPYSSGTFSFALIAAQPYGATDVYMDNLVVTYGGGSAPPETGRKKIKGLGYTPSGWMKKIYQWGD